jgi:hypothetical protein
MLPVCRTAGEGFALPTFEVVPSDVEGFMEELWEFQSAFHDCFTRSEPRAHFFDYPYSDTFRAYSSNTRIYGGAKGRFPLLLTTAKPRFYVDKCGRSPKVTL